MTNKKYIYNPQQASFFIEKGVRCTNTGVNPSTGRVYWEFDYYECQDAYEEWNSRKLNKN